MKIGFDAKRAFHNYTGLGNYSRFIIEALHTHFPDNNYYLFTPTTRQHQETAQLSKQGQVIIGPHQIKWLNSLWRSVYLFKTAKKHGLQVYHGLSNELPAWGGKGVKKVVTIHDLIFLRYPELYNAIDRQIYRWKFKRACARANVIIAISEQTKQDIVEYFGIDQEKVRVVYQGHHGVFNTEYTENQLLKIKKKYKLPGNYILNVGTLEKRKNVLLILKAMAAMENPLPVVLVGKPTKYKKELMDFIRENGLNDLVQFIHNAAFEDLPAIYQMSEVFVYPSLFEGFGIPIIEAQRSGVPVVTSKGSCFKEAGGEGAKYIDTADYQALAAQLEEIIGNKNLRNDMCDLSKKHLKQFSRQKIAADMNAIYQELLAT